MPANSVSTVTTFSWILYPYDHSLPVLYDEFVITAFRVFIEGNYIRIVLEEPSTPTRELEARQFAEKYTAELGRRLALPLRALTETEFASLPGWMDDGYSQMPNLQRIPRDPRWALRQARGKLLDSTDETLRRCYDYLQDADERSKESLSYLYKTIEAIENKLGGEGVAVAILNVEPALKRVKRLANASDRDERHAPTDPRCVRELTSSERDAALKDTRTVLRAYEMHLRATGQL